MLRFKPSWSIRRGSAACLLLVNLLNVFCISVAAFAAKESQNSAVPDWPGLVQIHQDRLQRLESDQSAVDMFAGTIGPAVALNDAAAAISAKGIPVKLANELRIPEITNSAIRLLAALTAWQAADRMTRALSDSVASTAASINVSASQVDWLTAHGPFPSLVDAVRQLTALEANRTDGHESGPHSTALAVAASRLVQEASQQTMAEWWRLSTWKDRVRVVRGQSRLCGTWQWVIHNHQDHHQDQKLSLLFPPPGKEGTGIPGLAEVVVLGDTVYLRWEVGGKTQEDSLLFSKEGQRLEGTFVNSQGGWGSISGKRTASCTLQ